jgi:hypothetical protein
VDVLRHVDGSLERVAAPKAGLVTARVAIRSGRGACSRVSLCMHVYSVTQQAWWSRSGESTANGLFSA